MLFNSPEFLIFFPVVSILLFSLPYRFRWVLLILASYYFYMVWRPKYVLIMLALTVIDYFAGIAIESAKTKSRRKLFLGLSLTANLGMLFFFKYYNFFSSQLNNGFNILGKSLHIPALDVVLPLGISFHTFQAMSYTIDIYRGEQKAEKHPGYFALFICYYPQLVAGPIERAKHLLPQLKKNFDFDYERAATGFRLMLWGFFKKLVIADNLGVFVDQVYNSSHSYQGMTLLLATYAFAWQIFCDFSGYTDIARGIGQIYGINLVENFNHPYWAPSVPEFWRRWHMSLTSWFRDYVYKPLRRRFPSEYGHWFAVFVVFLLSGFWHGANWTFLMWGFSNALFYVLNKIVVSAVQSWRVRQGLSAEFRFPRVLSIPITFNLISITWVFFRVSNIRDGIYILKTIAHNLFHGQTMTTAVDQVPQCVIYALVGILIVWGSKFVEKKSRFETWLGQRSSSLRWAGYMILVYGTIVFGNLSTQQFIYFQF